MTATVATVLDAAAGELAGTWQRHDPWHPTNSWQHSVPAAIAHVLAPWDTDADPCNLRASAETAELGREVTDFLAVYLLDHINPDFRCTTGDDEIAPVELDPVETIVTWECQEEMPGFKPLTADEVVTVVRAAAAEARARAAARALRTGVAA